MAVLTVCRLLSHSFSLLCRPRDAARNFLASTSKTKTNARPLHAAAGKTKKRTEQYLLGARIVHHPDRRACWLRLAVPTTCEVHRRCSLVNSVRGVQDVYTHCDLPVYRHIGYSRQGCTRWLFVLAFRRPPSLVHCDLLGTLLDVLVYDIRHIRLPDAEENSAGRLVSVA